MFKHAIVRRPAKSMIKGLTTAGLGLPDFELACQQHEQYIEALKICGMTVHTLEALEDFPDSTFVEDVALLTRKCAIITNPGADSRRGETVFIRDTIRSFYPDLDQIQSPGTLEAGDIMMVGDHFFIGLSERTNALGAKQLTDILERHGLTSSVVPLNEMLHLKTGLAYLENNNLLVYGEFIHHPAFTNFNRIEIPADEGYAANAIWVNDHILIPAGYPKSKAKIEHLGYLVHEVDVSEFKKLDGGLSCLSLRF
jgi:dimethylargininase